MRRIAILLLGVASLLGFTRSVSACAYGVTGPLEQFLASDYVILGKVTALEDCTVMQAANAGQPVQAQAFRVATVSVVESIKGAQGLSAIRVGFTPTSEPKVGAEGCFYLTATAHSFSIIAGGYVWPVFRNENPNFDKRMELPRRLGRLWENPTAGLRSKDADDRLLTAGLLLAQYRGEGRFFDGNAKLVPINAEYSQLILEVLAKADWSKPGPYRQTAPRLFGMLGLTAKDGWVPRNFKDTAEYEEAAKKWLKAHIVEHRILGLAQN